MVRLFRGARGRGVPRPSPATMNRMPRHIRPHKFGPDFIPPYGMVRPPIRLGPSRPPSGVPPPPPRMPPHSHSPRPIHPPHHPRGTPVPVSIPNFMHPPGPGMLHPRPIAPGPGMPPPRPLPPHPGMQHQRPVGLCPPVGPGMPPLRSIPPGPRMPPLRCIPPGPGMPSPRPSSPGIQPYRPIGQPPGPPLRRPLRPGPPFLRGSFRGGPLRRGVAVKRLQNGPNQFLQSKSQKKKLQKEEPFYCESCDRSWKTAEKLAEHVLEHEVCGRDGCTFTAHPKIVLKHVEAQHNSGLYHRIVFTQNPEDVAKWIAERKSRFPTKANIEKKEAQRNEMVERGERIPKQGKPFQKKQWRDKKAKNTNNIHNSRVDLNQQCKQLPKISINSNNNNKWRDRDSWRGDLPKFPGTGAFPLEESSENIIEENNFSDDGNEDVELSNTLKIDTPKPFVSSILLSLAADYGSDMSDVDDDNITTAIKNDTPFIRPEKDKLEENLLDTPVNKYVTTHEEITVVKEEDSDSGPEECGIDREDKLNIPVLKDDNKTNNAGKVMQRPKPPPRTPVKRTHYSLLENLLKNDIRHERNVILQCVRFVVKSNFLSSKN